MPAVSLAYIGEKSAGSITNHSGSEVEYFLGSANTGITHALSLGVVRYS